MCKTITTYYLGCSFAEGPTHTMTTTVECATAKIYRSKGFWFDCSVGSLTVWTDVTCSVCSKTPAKKLDRVLKNSVHTLRFFGKKGVRIQCCEEATQGQDNEDREGEAGCGNGWVVGRAVWRERYVSFWEVMQHVKIEIALEAKHGAMEGKETPGEIIGRILA